MTVVEAKADIVLSQGRVCLRPILLKKSFGGGERNFPEPLMRFVRNDVRDHVVSQKNDHGLSYWRYAASQRRTCPKINICEIFGVFRFSTFSTVSARKKLMRCSNGHHCSTTLWTWGRHCRGVRLIGCRSHLHGATNSARQPRDKVFPAGPPGSLT